MFKFFKAVLLRCFPFTFQPTHLMHLIMQNSQIASDTMPSQDELHVLNCNVSLHLFLEPYIEPKCYIVQEPRKFICTLGGPAVSELFLGVNFTLNRSKSEPLSKAQANTPKMANSKMAAAVNLKNS